MSNNAKYNKTVKKKIGYYIRRAREDQEMSRENLAKKLGVSLSYIYRIEGGYGGYSFVTLNKFAQALNKPIAYFYQWENQTDDINKIKDSEIAWRDGKKLNGSNIELILTRLMEYLQARQIEIPEQLNKIPDEQRLIELIKLLPSNLKKEIAQQILKETYFDL